MSSLFDRDDFNSALFFPRPDASPPGKSCVDLFVDVEAARIHIRIHRAASARCTLLLFHGNGEVVADYDDSAGQFARCGATLAVADYRGYGQSTGSPTLRSLITDARPIAEAVQAHLGPPLIVMGRSLGGAAAHELYAHPLDGMIGVVLESSFFDLGRLIGRRGLAAPAAFTDEESRTFDPRTKLRAGRLPLLVLHGERDQLITPDEAASALAAAGTTDKELVPVPGRGHNDVSFSETYWNALARFVGRLRSV
jgi:alpha-beta hydrolase superfamily lysophospholipase